MKSIATIKLKIPKNKLLLQTVKRYSKAIQYISNQGFKAEISNRYKLHHLCYYKARELFKLPSPFVINANRVASQTCSRCGKIGSRSKGFFVCHCGYSLNADLNASFNLAKQHSNADGVLGSVTNPYIQSDDVKGSFRATTTELMDKSHQL